MSWGEGSTSRTLVDVDFPITLPAGTRVWFTAYWFNPRLQAGPACNPVGANVPLLKLTQQRGGEKVDEAVHDGAGGGVNKFGSFAEGGLLQTLGKGEQGAPFGAQNLGAPERVILEAGKAFVVEVVEQPDYSPLIHIRGPFGVLTRRTSRGSDMALRQGEVGTSPAYSQLLIQPSQSRRPSRLEMSLHETAA